MRIGLIHNAKFPVVGYGGTERAVWWLAKGLFEKGYSVSLFCKPESQCPYATPISLDSYPDIEKAFPMIDVFHYFHTPEICPTRPYVVTIEGNGKLGETYWPNTAFVSANHAERHGAECFVHNGVDPDDYVFENRKKDYLVFLAKAAWHVKNVRGAIRYAREKNRELRILGGKRWWLNHFRGIHWEGILGGPPKAQWVSGAAGMLNPIIWNEPFGIAVVESLVSGTPVIATRLGSMPELITDDVGFLCATDEDFLRAIDQLPSIRPENCRDWAIEQFHYRVMTKNYVNLYERVRGGETLNSRIPTATGLPEQTFPIFGRDA